MTRIEILINYPYFNPLPSHEGRHCRRYDTGRSWRISIHFPLTREDHSNLTEQDYQSYFNPLPSHEGRQSSHGFQHPPLHFNPLPSHEGRPWYLRKLIQAHPNFNPLPSHEGRLQRSFLILPSQIFQSTSLSRGKTVLRAIMSVGQVIFQSTSLSRGKTCNYWEADYCEYFNPLPSHEGRHWYGLWTRWNKYFNPLPSHEGRLPCGKSERQKQFQSTSLSRGKTYQELYFYFCNLFQSTSLSRGKTIFLIM